jgi:Flp pilus assembly pilin Flp
MNTMIRLVRDRRGANMVEYIIMVGMVALIAFAGFKIFGSAVSKKINDQGTAVGGVNGAAGP